MISHPHPGQSLPKILSQAKSAILAYHVQSAQSNMHYSAADPQIYNFPIWYG